MATRPNFYLLLDLDPNIEDSAAISKAIQNKRQSWSKQQSMGNPASAAEAKANLARIAEIQALMNDPEERRKEADQARLSIKERYRADSQLLDRMIAVLLKGGGCTQRDIAKILADLGGRISEQEVLKRVQDSGLSVESAAAAKTRTRDAKPRLDAARMDQLRPNLKFLGVKDLYEFLGMSRQSSVSRLWECADQRNKELIRIGRTDAQTNTAKALCGQCMAIFDSQENKAKYDNSVALEDMEGMRPLIELAGGGNNFLSIEQLDELVRQAREFGVAAADARAFIEAVAASRKWGLQPANKLPSEALRQCGNCSKLAKSANETHCSSCGEPLTIRCPRCNNVVPTEHVACANCGFHIGDWNWIKIELEKADKLISELRVDDASKQLKVLVRGWPGWKILQSRLDETERLTKEREKEQANVLDLVRQGKLFQAQGEAGRYAGKWGRDHIAAQLARISDAIASARKAFAEGEKRRLNGKFEEAIAQYRGALATCADFIDARKALALIPPRPPDGLTAMALRHGFQLRWEATDKTVDGYAVVRKAGSAPLHAEDGADRHIVRDTTFIDAEVPEGVPWYYAVFSYRDDIFSATATRSGPHLRVAPVNQLTAVAGDGQILLTWSLPMGAIGADVWRRQGAAPDRPGLGVHMPAARNSFHDLGLPNDVAVGYLVAPRFEDPQRPGAIIYGPGTARLATPTVPPPPVMDLCAERMRGGVRLTWTPPNGKTHVSIRQLAREPEYKVGTILSRERSDALGTSVVATARDSADVQLAAAGEVWFLPLSVKAGTAVVGQPVSISLIDGLQHLAVDRDDRNIYLRWDWPPGARKVAVCDNYSHFPAAPNDADVIRHDVTFEQYQRDGMFALRHVERRSHYLALFVTTPDGRLYSEPLTRFVQMGKSREVRYRIVSPANFFSRPWRATRQLELEISGTGHVPKTVLVAKPRVAPIGPDDGEKIVHLPEMELGGICRVPIPNAVAKPGNVAKLFFIDPHHADEIRLVSGSIHELKL